MSSLSIVVPRLGTHGIFEATLASILRHRMPHHQVVVIQSDLQADTYGLEDEIDFVEVAGRPGWAKYFNLIESSVKHEAVNLIRPGIEVTQHWFAQAIRHLQSERVGAVACSLATAQHRDEIISCGLISNSSMIPGHATDWRQKPLGPCGWAGFYRRDVLKAIGPLDVTLSDEFAALDLALSIRGLGLACEVVHDRVLSIADAERLKLPVRQQTGRDAQRMVQRHVPRNEQRIGSALATFADLARGFWKPSRWTQVAGRFSAQSKQASDRAFRRQLDLARAELENLAMSKANGMSQQNSAA